MEILHRRPLYMEPVEDDDGMKSSDNEESPFDMLGLKEALTDSVAACGSEPSASVRRPLNDVDISARMGDLNLTSSLENDLHIAESHASRHGSSASDEHNIESAHDAVLEHSEATGKAGGMNCRGPVHGQSSAINDFTERRRARPGKTQQVVEHEKQESEEPTKFRHVGPLNYTPALLPSQPLPPLHNFLNPAPPDCVVSRLDYERSMVGTAREVLQGTDSVGFDFSPALDLHRGIVGGNGWPVNCGITPFSSTESADGRFIKQGHLTNEARFDNSNVCTVGSVLRYGERSGASRSNNTLCNNAREKDFLPLYRNEQDFLPLYRNEQEERIQDALEVFLNVLPACNKSSVIYEDSGSERFSETSPASQTSFTSECYQNPSNSPLHSLSTVQTDVQTDANIQSYGRYAGSSESGVPIRDESDDFIFSLMRMYGIFDENGLEKIPLDSFDQPKIQKPESCGHDVENKDINNMNFTKNTNYMAVDDNIRPCNISGRKGSNSNNNVYGGPVNINSSISDNNVYAGPININNNVYGGPVNNNSNSSDNNVYAGPININNNVYGGPVNSNGSNSNNVNSTADHYRPMDLVLDSTCISNPSSNKTSSEESSYSDTQSMSSGRSVGSVGFLSVTTMIRSPYSVSPEGHRSPEVKSPTASGSTAPSGLRRDDETACRLQASRKVAEISLPDLLHSDEHGDTTLHLAVIEENYYLTEALVRRYTRENKLDEVINILNSNMQAPLCLAVILNEPRIVELLITEGADVNAYIKRSSSIAERGLGASFDPLLHFSAARGQHWLRVLRLILNSGKAHVDSFNSEGQSAVHCAILAHNKPLKDSGARRASGEVVNCFQTITALSKAGANLNIQDQMSGKTPLHCAVEERDLELVQRFLLAASYSEHQTENSVHKLLSARTNSGNTALHLAASVQMTPDTQQKLIRLLISKGADPSLKNSDGCLPREVASSRDIVKLLRGQNPSSSSSSSSPKNLKC